MNKRAIIPWRPPALTTKVDGIGHESVEAAAPAKKEKKAAAPKKSTTAAKPKVTKAKTVKPKVAKTVGAAKPKKSTKK